MGPAWSPAPFSCRRGEAPIDRTPAGFAMTKGEREDLQRLIRQREKVLKSAARQRTAELIADFENQMGQEYSFDQDEVWEQAVKSVEPLVRKAQEQIAVRCRALGIPRQFAPGLSLAWKGRGYDNSIERRRRELRVMAKTQIEAIEQNAIVQIELSCLEAQTKLAIAGLTSDSARSFIEQLPSIEVLMPRLSFAEVAGEAEPPIAEQLISPNALRQRRYRERQRLALQNAHNALQALRPRVSNATEDGKGAEPANVDPASSSWPELPESLRREAPKPEPPAEPSTDIAITPSGTEHESL